MISFNVIHPEIDFFCLLSTEIYGNIKELKSTREKEEQRSGG